MTLSEYYAQDSIRNLIKQDRKAALVLNYIAEQTIPGNTTLTATYDELALVLCINRETVRRAVKILIEKQLLNICKAGTIRIFRPSCLGVFEPEWSNAHIDHYAVFPTNIIISRRRNEYI